MATIEKLRVSWAKIGEQIEEIGRRIEEQNANVDRVVGIARGGLPISVDLSHRFNAPLSVVGVSSYNDTTNEQETLICDTLDEIFDGWTGSIVICDDIADSGKTLEFLLEKIADNSQISKITLATLYYKETSVIKPDIFIETTDKWVVFPWEWE